MPQNDRTIFQPTLNPAGTVPLVTEAPQQSSALASAIQGVTEISASAVRKNLKGQAQEEFSREYEDYVADEEATNLAGAVQQTAALREQTEDFFDKDEVAPAEEALLLTDMQQRINKWNKAFHQKRIPASEFKVKMEATLKKYIAMAPGLAGEFRQAAAGVLGFDPSGAEFRAIEASQKGKADKSEQVKKLTLGAIDKTRLLDPSLSDDENIARYGSVAYDLLRREDYLDVQTKALNAMDKMDKRTNNMLASQHVGVSLQSVSSQLGRITTADSPESKSQQIDSLTAMKSQLGAEYRRSYPHLTGAEIDAKLKPVTDMIDTAVDVVNGKRSKDILENMRKANTESVIVDLQSTPKGARFVAATQLFKGWTTFPATVRNELGEGTKLLYNTKVDMLGTDGSQSPFQTAKDLKNENAKKDLTQWFSNSAVDMLNNLDVNQPDQLQAYQNTLEGIMVPMFSDPERVEAIEWDTMLKMAGNPKFVEVMDKLPDSARVKEKLAKTSAAYSVAVLRSFGQKVFENYDPEERRTLLDNNPMLMVDPKSIKLLADDVELVRDEDNLFVFIPRDGLSPKQIDAAQSEADRLNKNYLSRFNDAIKVSAHLRGHTKYGAMIDQLKSRIPELVPFMERGQKDNADAE